MVRTLVPDLMSLNSSTDLLCGNYISEKSKHTHTNTHTYTYTYRHTHTHTYTYVNKENTNPPPSAVISPKANGSLARCIRTSSI